jgi:hypothetical protein
LRLSNGRIHSSSARITAAEISGTATNSPIRPKSWETTTTPMAISAGCSLTARAITSGTITLPSICCTIR